MAEQHSTATHAPRRARPPAPKPLEYSPGDGALSFRYGLCARERNTLDRALAIVSRTFRGGDVFRSPGAVKAYLRLHLGAERHEKFAVMFLDAQNRAIAFEVMFVGTLTQTSVYPREVVQCALAHGASAVILAHNHPSGAVHPSKADEILTQTLKGALALMDVRVIDHIIVGSTDALSMAEMGLV